MSRPGQIKRMKQKLRAKSGITLVEMLAAVLILSFLGLILHTGLALAVQGYRKMTVKSETELLLSTVTDVLTNELRYARDVRTQTEEGDEVLQDYTSVSFGRHTTLALDENGQMQANGKRMLSTGAYGKGAYKISEFKITYKDGVFEVKLEVEGPDSISMGTELSVRCLNPPAPEKGSGG